MSAFVATLLAAGLVMGEGEPIFPGADQFEFVWQSDWGRWAGAALPFNYEVEEDMKAEQEREMRRVEDNFPDEGAN